MSFPCVFVAFEGLDVGIGDEETREVTMSQETSHDSRDVTLAAVQRSTFNVCPLVSSRR